jgi:hypothetical protein
MADSGQIKRQLILKNLHQRMMLSGLCVTAMLLAFAPLNATAEEKAAADGTGKLSLG